MSKRRSLFLASVLMAGCGGMHAELPEDLIYSLPRDERIVIYDAENDVVIARSRQDDAERRILKLRQDLKDLSERWDRTKERLDKTHNDRTSKAKDVYVAKRKYIDESLDIAKIGLDVSEAQVDAATARLELARARQLVRLGTLEEAKLKDFEEVVKDREKRSKDVDKKEVDMRIESQKSLTAWKDAEDAYARATGDFDSLVWID